MKLAAVACLVLASTIGEPAYAADASRQCQLMGVFSFAIDLKQGRLFTDGSINDMPVRFIIDTGSFDTFISAKSATRIGLNYYLGGSEMFTLAGRQSLKVTRVDRWKLGDTPVDGVDMAVIGLDFGDGIDGILGPDVLASYDIEIDAASATMTFFQPAACLKGVAYWSPEDYQSVPLRVTSGSHIQIPVTVNGTKVQAVLDTGAPVSALSGLLAKSLGITRGSPGVERDSAKDDANRHENHSYYRLPSISIDGEQMRNFRVAILWDMQRRLRTHEWSKADLIPKPDWERPEDAPVMLLGMDFIARNHLYISYKNHFLAFTPYTAQKASAAPAP